MCQIQVDTHSKVLRLNPVRGMDKYKFLVVPESESEQQGPIQ